MVVQQVSGVAAQWHNSIYGAEKRPLYSVFTSENASISIKTNEKHQDYQWHVMNDFILENRLK